MDNDMNFKTPEETLLAVASGRGFTRTGNVRIKEKFLKFRNFFYSPAFGEWNVAKCATIGWGGMKRDYPGSEDEMRAQTAGADDGLGPNSDIGSRLRALYGAVQDEGVPEKLLDLLERLDAAERKQASNRERQERK